MRRIPVILLEGAISDLQDIYRYIAGQSGSPTTAIRFIRRIRRRCQRIGQVPFGGRARDDLQVGLRTVPFERSTIIVYKVETARVRIVNIFYGGRDYESLYQGGTTQGDDTEG
jgi:toxin ParE1/3/4